MVFFNHFCFEREPMSDLSHCMSLQWIFLQPFTGGIGWEILLVYTLNVGLK